MIPEQHEAEINLIQHLGYEDAKYIHDLAAFKVEIKLCVDWFLIKYNNLLSKRCIRAARLLNIRGNGWEDLKSECQIEAYRIAERFDPVKGDFVKFMLSSLWNHMFRTKYVRSYTDGGIEDFDNLVFELKDNIDVLTYKHDFCESTDPDVNSLLEGLEWHEKSLLNCKMVLGMSNVEIAKQLGLNSEGTVRKRLQNILDKIKIRGT